MNGQRQLQRLARAIERNQQIPPDVRRWFVDGVRRWSAGRVELAAALDVTASVNHKAIRNLYLREVWKRMPERWSDSERFRRLERAAQQLERYPDARDVDWTGAPPWHEFLLLAIQSAPLPKEKQLRNILSNSQEDFQKAGRQSN